MVLEKLDAAAAATLHYTQKLAQNVLRLKCNTWSYEVPRRKHTQ